MPCLTHSAICLPWNIEHLLACRCCSRRSLRSCWSVEHKRINDYLFKLHLRQRELPLYMIKSNISPVLHAIIVVTISFLPSPDHGGKVSTVSSITRSCFLEPGFEPYGPYLNGHGGWLLRTPIQCHFGSPRLSIDFQPVEAYPFRAFEHRCDGASSSTSHHLCDTAP